MSVGGSGTTTPMRGYKEKEQSQQLQQRLQQHQQQLQAQAQAQVQIQFFSNQQDEQDRARMTTKLSFPQQRLKSILESLGPSLTM